MFFAVLYGIAGVLLAAPLAELFIRVRTRRKGSEEISAKDAKS